MATRASELDQGAIEEAYKVYDMDDWVHMRVSDLRNT